VSGLVWYQVWHYTTRGSGSTTGLYGSEIAVDLKSLLESLLFVAGYPVSVQDLAGALEVGVDEVNEALQALSVEYRERGIR
jgi:DNA-binding GntR family transcriptional regulator